MLPRERIPGLPVGLLEKIKTVPIWVWFIVAIPVLLLLGVPMVGLAHYTTSSSEYCLSCHAAGDTPNKGVKSLVHPGFDRVSCVDCHAKAGQVVYEGYVNGFAAEPERVSTNCVRCHEAMPLRNDVQGFKFNFVNINISHKNHVERGATCATCHLTIAHDLDVPQTNRPRMETCYQCHTVNDSCTKCHTNGPPSGAVPMPAAGNTGMESDGRILYLRTCSACHGGRGDQIESRKLSSQAFLESKGDRGIFESVSAGHGNMPSFGVAKGGTLSDDQIRAIIGYLKELSRAPTGPINAQAIFESRCIVCHGEDGSKMEGVRLADPAFLKGIGDALSIKTVSDGKAGMPAFSKERGGPLSREEINAVYGYVKGLAKNGQTNGQAGNAQAGKELFTKSCASCHGPNGDSLGSANLASKAFLDQRGQDGLIKATEEGKGGMPAFGTAKGGQLSKEQVSAIVAYLLGAAK